MSAQAVDTLAVLDKHMAAERAEGGQCQVTVKMRKDGTVSARMSFSPGMEAACGTGRTVSEALQRLADLLAGGL